MYEPTSPEGLSRLTRRAPLISSRSKRTPVRYFVTVRGRVRARAFAPAHVTGVFAPAVEARDPRGRGSTGAGIVLELGVRAFAEFRPGHRRVLRLVSDLDRPLPISLDVARRLGPSGPGTLTVRLTHQLPVGQGFGMSAAGAAATALAVGALTLHSRREALEVAHLADLFGGGGLGGVASIQGGGGLELRTRGGLPPWGRTLHRPFSGGVLVGIVGGPLPSPHLLRNPRFLRQVVSASAGLEELLRRPDADRFFDLSEQFTDRLGLAPPPLSRVLKALRRRDAWAAQAMFGRSFFARPKGPTARDATLRWLQAAGIPTVELSAATRGARVVRTLSTDRIR
jgi:pantoate kinase